MVVSVDSSIDGAGPEQSLALLIAVQGWQVIFVVIIGICRVRCVVFVANVTVSLEQAEPIVKKAAKDHVVVGLRDRIAEIVVFFQKPHRFFGRRVDGQMLRFDLFTLEHVVEQLSAKAASLLTFVYVKVQHTQGSHLMILTLIVVNEQLFLAHF